MLQVDTNNGSGLDPSRSETTVFHVISLQLAIAALEFSVRMREISSSIASALQSSTPVLRALACRCLRHSLATRSLSDPDPPTRRPRTLTQDTRREGRSSSQQVPELPGSIDVCFHQLTEASHRALIPISDFRGMFATNPFVAGGSERLNMNHQLHGSVLHT